MLPDDTKVDFFRFAGSAFIQRHHRADSPEARIARQACDGAVAASRAELPEDSRALYQVVRRPHLTVVGAHS